MCIISLLFFSKLEFDRIERFKSIVQVDLGDLGLRSVSIAFVAHDLFFRILGWLRGTGLSIDTLATAWRFPGRTSRRAVIVINTQVGKRIHGILVGRTHGRAVSRTRDRSRLFCGGSIVWLELWWLLLLELIECTKTGRLLLLLRRHAPHLWILSHHSTHLRLLHIGLRPTLLIRRSGLVMLLWHPTHLLLGLHLTKCRKTLRVWVLLLLTHLRLLFTRRRCRRVLLLLLLRLHLIERRKAGGLLVLLLRRLLHCSHLLTRRRGRGQLLLMILWLHLIKGYKALLLMRRLLLHHVGLTTSLIKVVEVLLLRSLWVTRLPLRWWLLLVLLLWHHISRSTATKVSKLLLVLL